LRPAEGGSHAFVGLCQLCLKADFAGGLQNFGQA